MGTPEVAESPGLGERYILGRKGLSMNRELKLPDHVLLRADGSLMINERRSGRSKSVVIDQRPTVVTKGSRMRFIGAVAAAVFASYFSYMFLPDVFTSAWEMAALPVMMSVPIMVGAVSKGKVALVSYLAGFLVFAAVAGGLAGQLRIGFIFLGGGPLDYQGIAYVPASDLVVVLFLGMVPYATFAVLGQAMRTYEVIFEEGGQRETITLRDPGMVRDVMDYLGFAGESARNDRSGRA
jgi:hypothetical protein